ncbi:ABC-type multidrug transport system, permease component [Saccharomonospora marina XMU15]|uniref:ABC-type multidrug transport system, permease component n=1 Tax=Saccharomonospora marina XMU15 TaxID=882083 RepID=H5X2N1_9PSEU|nr:ABC transporter permease [Saccharomonospora marina]EHR50970.1 ABC-type multidrug transport system, permease component [Saccharomonospora marina XMU15]
MTPPTALLIAGKDLRQRSRDRSALVLVFIAPLVVAALISLAFGSAERFHADVAVVDNDNGPVSAGFTAMLRGDELRDVLTVHPVADEATVRMRVDSGELGAAFVLPEGLSRGTRGAAAPDITVLSGVDSSVSALVASSVADAFVAQLNADTLSVNTALAAGVPADRAAELARQAAALSLPEQVRPEPAGTEQVDAKSYYAPAMGILFMLFTIGFGARGWFAERDGATLDRIAAAPLATGSLLVGKALATFAYGVAGLSTVAVVTSLAFGADWGPPPAAAAVIVAMGLSLVALTALVIAVSRTQRQAEGIAATVTFGLALIGGNFVFLSTAPPLLSTIAMLTPNGWALRAFTDLSSGAPWTSIGVPILAILAFCAVTGGAALLLARRGVAR